MKKYTLIMALTTVCAMPAWAQSSVQLYGRLNVTLENQKKGSERGWVTADNRSRFGMRGVEDLGGGLKAGFVLEQGFDADENSSVGTFNREAYVSLSGRWGAMRMGHWFADSYLSTADYVSLHNHDTGNSADALYAFAVFPEYNKIGYFTPEWNGLVAGAAVALGEKKETRLVDLSAQYNRNNLFVGAGYSEQGAIEQYAVSALYTINPVTFGGYVQRESQEGSLYGESREVYRLVGMYTLGASEFHLNAGYTTQGATQKYSAKQYTVAYNYNLSKRTKLYTYYTDLNPNGAADDRFNSVAFGIRHNF